MGPRVVILSIVLATVMACRQAPPAKQYELQGQIVAIDRQHQEVTIKHGDIKGFMPAMTMPFPVKDPSLLEGKTPGDLVTATLVVPDVGAHLSTLTTTGHAALEEPPPAASPILRPGDPVADAALVDQDGRPHPFSSLRGNRVALTFIYTRCPLPDFCPLMNRNFAAVQKALKSNRALADVRLVTMTLDPEFDTPAVLKPLARAMDADPAVWSFLTGDPAAVNRFGAQFGVYTEKDAQSPGQIIHNLRTAVIDASGRLVKIESGNSWTPADLVASLEATPAATE
jgi:protein SCO1/2